MALGLKRYHHSGCTHFITFSCYRRQPFLSAASAANRFIADLERVRQWYGIRIYGYVVMPEHVHLLLSEPERAPLSIAIQMLKQVVSRELRHPLQRRFWQVRYFDSLIHNRHEFFHALQYTHRNPVKRALCQKPEDWRWSSFLHYATGADGMVEIESDWTARRRERMGVVLNITRSVPDTHPSPKPGERVGHDTKSRK